MDFLRAQEQVEENLIHIHVSKNINSYYIQDTKHKFLILSLLVKGSK